jgi:hypothetical protein
MNNASEEAREAALDALMIFLQEGFMRKVLS